MRRNHPPGSVRPQLCPDLPPSPSTSRWGKSWSRTSGNLEDLVESGKSEDVPDVAVDVDQPQGVPALRQAFLSREEDSQAGAGDVVEAGEVERFPLAERQENAPGLLHLRRIEASGENQIVIAALADLQHSIHPFEQSHRAVSLVVTVF